MAEEKSPIKSNSEHSEENSKEKEKKSTGAEQATILDEELKNLPKEVRELIISSQSRYVGPMPNPIASKITEAHIDKILDISDKEEERVHKRSIHGKIFAGFVIIVAVAIFIFLTMYLSTSNKELYVEIIKIVAIFFGGFGGGYGLKSYLDRDAE